MGGGTGWRRAFCTTIPRDPEVSFAEKPTPSPSPSPRIRSKFGFLSGSGGGRSNPSTPKLEKSQQASSIPNLSCRTTPQQQQPTVQDSPKLQCKTTSCASIKSPRLFQSSSNPSSPSRFSLFKTSLRLSRSSCGICLQNVKTGQGTAIFTAECSHAFHFPCIAAHVRKNGNLVCPVCSSNWREVPLLALHKNQLPSSLKPSNDEKPSKPSDQRLYDDDEPLLSPTASAARFNPIPEADEDEEDEDEIQEFQGFFVNPNTSFCDDGGDSTILRNVEVKLLPVSSAVVSVGKNHETYVVALKVKAPPPQPPPARTTGTGSVLDPKRRAPIDLVTVLDVSGSMTGAKLQMLKRAMRLLISSLSSSDRLSIVAFSSYPKRLLPLKRMTPHGQKFARRLIDRLVCGQGSSVSSGDALKKATKVLEDRRERNPVASVMLLSDGQDERSKSSKFTSNSTNHVSSTRFSHLEIPVDASSVEDAFAKCVGGLLSVVVQDLRLQIGLSSGSAPAEVTAVYSCNGRPTCLGSAGTIRLGDLYAEEERELLVELRVPTVPVRAHHVIAVRCSHKDPATQELIYSKEQALLVPRPHAVRSSEPKIERLRSLYVTTRAIAEARRFIEHHNDLANAYRLLSSARALLKQSSSSIPCDDYINGLESELKDLQYRRQQREHQQQNQQQQQIQRSRASETAYFDENGEPLTPTSAWRAAEQLAKVAIMRKSMNKVGDLHGFENARF